MKKQGLSPVIATILLIAIALILAVIIFLWARGFLAEQNQKFGEPIANACKTVDFEAEAFSSSTASYVSIVNRGNVPIYALEIRKKSEGTIEKVGTFEGEDSVVHNGETGNVQLTEMLEVGTQLTIIPIILGEKGSERTPYPCEISYAKEAIVQNSA